jgi:CopG family nickel-responsive transcriptional regulator
MSRIKRVGVTFPPDLLKDLDSVIESAGIENRSRAVQDAVRMFVAEKRLLQNTTGSQVGFVMMLYNHEAKGLETALTNVQHRYADIICSTMHVHLSETDCLEAIAVKGNVDQVRRLRDELAAKKGMKLLKVTVLSE